MNKQEPQGGDRSGDDQALERLFAHAKPRPMPPEADAEAIRNAVFAEWDAATSKRSRVRRTGLAAAALVLSALGLWWSAWQPLGDAPLATVAEVERVDGAVESAGAQLVLGGTLVEGVVVTTGNGQVALRLASGGSLRVGPRSTVALRAPDAAELLSGVLYFDSENERVGNDFTVTTTLGSVRDVGTQFLARLDSGRFDVGVRDGRIELTSGPATDGAGVGERLVVSQAAGSIRRDEISPVGDEWEWAERLAPPFDVNGRTVGDFLAWFSSQTGRKVAFGSPAAERIARETVLSGSIDLAPMQKLSAVLALTDLTYRLDGERVVIDAR